MPSVRQCAPFQPALVIAPGGKRGEQKDRGGRHSTISGLSSLLLSLPTSPPSSSLSSGIILWLWSVELGVMWAKALSASTQRGKQSLIVGTHRKKKPATVYGLAIEGGEGFGADLVGMSVNHRHLGSCGGRRVGKGEWTEVQVRKRERELDRE